MSPTKIEQRRKFSTLDRLRQSYLSILLENIRFASYTRRLLQKRTEIKNCISFQNILNPVLWKSIYKQKKSSLLL